MKELQDALKEGRVMLGFRRCLKALKSSNPKLVIIANNLPVSMEKQILHNAKLCNAQVKRFEGSSKELGTACGKPFAVSVVVIN